MLILSRTLAYVTLTLSRSLTLSLSFLCRPESTKETNEPWSTKENPGSNCELNTIIATLSTGPVGLSDKTGQTNVTIVWRCARADGRLLQPDKPATAVDSTFAPLSSGRVPPPGMVSTTYTRLSSRVWYYLLSIDVRTPWNLLDDDLFPLMARGEGWLAHPWFTSQAPTACAQGSSALASGCVLAHVHSASDIPPIHNTRPLAAQNDTHVFDLLELAPVVHGWVLLGEVERYVRVSRDRFDGVDFAPSGIRMQLVGSEGETVALTALQLMAGGKRDWMVLVKRVTFPKGSGGRMEVAFP